MDAPQPTRKMPYLFYGYRGVESRSSEAPQELSPILVSEVWRPSFGHVRPEGFAYWPYVVWALFGWLRIFRGPGYAIHLIRDAATRRVLHRSHVFPRWFRFPFMKPTDLQIGDTFTELDYRGKGFAERTLREIVLSYGKPGVTLWYVVSEENAASIRVAEKCGLELLGRGIRVKRLGMRIFGSYVMDDPSVS